MPEIQYKVDLPAFTGRNVPIKEIAKAMGKDAQYVRVGIQQGVLKFGVAIKMEDSNEYNYYCPDKKVWEALHFLQLKETWISSLRLTSTQSVLGLYIAKIILVISSSFRLTLYTDCNIQRSRGMPWIVYRVKHVCNI